MSSVGHALSSAVEEVTKFCTTDILIMILIGGSRSKCPPGTGGSVWHKAPDEIYRLYNYIAEVIHDRHVLARYGQASLSMRRDSSGTVDQPEHAHFHVK